MVAAGGIATCPISLSSTDLLIAVDAGTAVNLNVVIGCGDVGFVLISPGIRAEEGNHAAPDTLSNQHRN